MIQKDGPARERPEDQLLYSSVALQSLSDGVIICDRAGVVRFINPACARLLQVDADAYVGQLIGTLPGDIALPTEIGDQPHEQIIDIGYSDWRCRITPIWSTTGISSHIGFLAIIKPVYLELLDAAELSSIIGYELRAPLTSITGGTELLLRGLVGELSEQQREMLQIVAHSSRRIFGVVNTLFAIMRIDSGRMRVFAGDEKIPEIVDELLVSKQQLIDERSISCEVTFATDRLNARVDRSKLHEILSHLLDNACHYTPVGGQVGIDVNITADQLCCAIRDTGIGISEHAQSRVFVGPVNDYANPLRDNINSYTGSGLSLLITKRLVDLHGGTIWFESTVGQGSTFHVTLPLPEAV